MYKQPSQPSWSESAYSNQRSWTEWKSWVPQSWLNFKFIKYIWQFTLMLFVGMRPTVSGLRPNWGVGEQISSWHRFLAQFVQKFLVDDRQRKHVGFNTKRGFLVGTMKIYDWIREECFWWLGTKKVYKLLYWWQGLNQGDDEMEWRWESWKKCVWKEGLLATGVTDMADQASEE